MNKKQRAEIDRLINFVVKKGLLDEGLARQMTYREKLDHLLWVESKGEANYDQRRENPEDEAMRFNPDLW